MNKHNQNKKGKKLIATNNKKTHIIVPIIVMLILTSLIATIVVGIHLTNNDNQQIAEVENGEEEIKAAATDVAARSVGTNVNASFDATTKTVTISSTSGTGTIDKALLKTFFLDCGSFDPRYENINGDNVIIGGGAISRPLSHYGSYIKIITFANKVYAPEDSTSLLNETIGYRKSSESLRDIPVRMNFLEAINNLNNLDVSNVTNMSGMLVNNVSTIDISNWDISKVTTATNMFSSTASNIYTPKTYSTTSIPLPAKYYNSDNANDNNAYESFNNTTFTGSVHLSKLISYSITYDLDGGSASGNPTSYHYLSSFSLNAPTKTGHTFLGWTGSNGTTPQTTVSITPRTTTGDLTYTANWQKNKYSLTVNPNGGTWDGKTTSSTINNIEYDSSKTIAHPTRTGYKIESWTVSGEGSRIYTYTNDSTFYMGHENATITADWVEDIVNYKVEHYKQNVDGKTYELADTNDYEAKTGDTIEAIYKTEEEYVGFTSPTEPTTAVVAADGSTVVKYYYPRKSYKLTLEKGNENIIAGTDGAGNYLYGAKVTGLSATLQPNGPEWTYSWTNWTNKATGREFTKKQTGYEFEMPAENLTLVANGTREKTKHRQIIQVRYQNGDGSYTQYANE